MQNYSIAGYKRTPIGSYKGKLSHFNALDLATIASEAVLNSTNIDKSDIDCVILGCAFSSGLGQSPARQLANRLKIKCPASFSVSKLCATGMAAISCGLERLKSGSSNAVLVCGVESMSNVDFSILKKDGLLDVESGKSMGEISQKLSNEYDITREQLDKYTISSFRSGESLDLSEIVPIELEDGSIMKSDEPLEKLNEEKLYSLEGIFESENMTLTKAHCSKIADGAAAMLLVDSEYAMRLGISSLAYIKKDTQVFVEPTKFPEAIIEIIDKFEKYSPARYEIHEAFSSIPLMVFQRYPDLSKKTNIYGAAVSLGHPFGCTALRMVGTLALQISNEKLDNGAAIVCVGGGEGMGIYLERAH